MANDPFANFKEDGTTVALDPFANFKEDAAPKVDPFEQSKSYLQSAGDGLPDDIRSLPAAQQFAAFKNKALPFHETAPLEQLKNATGDGISAFVGHPLNSISNAYRSTSDAVGGLLYAGSEGLANADAETEAKRQGDVSKYGPVAGNVLTTGRVIGSLGAGAISGIYGLGETLERGGNKLANALDAVDPTAPGTDAQKAEQRTLQDFQQRKYNDARKGVVGATTNFTGLPGAFHVGEQVGPAVVPIGTGLEVGKYAPGLADSIVNLAPKAAADVLDTGAGLARLTQATAKPAGTIVGAVGGGSIPGIHAAAGLPGLYYGAKAGGVVAQGAEKAGDYLRSLAGKAANVDTSSLVGTRQAITAGINAGAGTATGAAFGLANAPSGSEGESTLQGAAFGALACPLAAIHGGFARQGLEQAARAGEFVEQGAKPYGDKALDEQHAAAMATLSPEDQAQVNAARGLYRGLKDGKNPVRIAVQTPEEFAAGATKANNGQVSDASGAAGYYLDNGTVYINSDTASGNIGVTLSQALGHEATHPLASVLTGIDAKQGQALYDSAKNAAVKDEQPTPNFQRFIDAYNGEPVDWNSLPDTGDGLSKQYFYNELGAQTGAALDAIKNPGKYALPKEASDVAFDALGDYARRKGLLKLPDVSQGLLGQNAPIPADAGLYANTREGFRTIAQADRSPVVNRGQTNPVASPLYDPADFARQPLSLGQRPNTGPYAVQPANLGQPIAGGGISDGSLPTSQAGGKILDSPTANPKSLTPEASNPSANPTLSPRTTQAYQDAHAIATLPKKLGGLGLSTTEATVRLDQSANNPNVANTAESYLFHLQTGKPMDARTSTNLQGQTNQVPQPAVEAPASDVQLPTSVQSSLQNESPTTNQASPVSSVPVVPTPQEQVSLQSTQPLGGQDSQSLVKIGTEFAPISPGIAFPSALAQEQVSASRPLIDLADVVSPTQTQQGSIPPQNTVVSSLSKASLDPFADLSPKVLADDNTNPANVLSPQPQRSLPKATNTIEKQESSNSSQQASVSVEEPQVISRKNPQGLTAADVARIREEAKAAHEPKPYPRSSPESRAEKQAADLSAAQRQAVLEAHAEAQTNPSAVQLRADPDTGKQSLSGSYLSEFDPVHKEILDGLDADTRSHLSAIENAIAEKTPVNFDYMSADTKGQGTTGKGRSKAQSLSDADSRASGDGAVEEANKLFYPYSISVTKDNNVIAHGFSPDKLIANAERVLNYRNDRGDTGLPYRNVNDPQFVRDYANYAENHNNGYKGNGEPLVGTDAIPIAQTEGYQPHVIPQDRADFLNLITQGKTEQATAETPKGAAIREFAKANGLSVDEANREVSALRAQMNDREDFQAPTPDGMATGTKAVMHSALFENVRTDLIRNMRPVDENPAGTGNLYSQGFQGDRRALTEAGNPSSKISGSGFLPTSTQPITDNPTAYGRNSLRATLLPRPKRDETP